MMDGRNERPVPNLHSSALTKREAICVLVYLPVHVALLPLLLGRLIAEGTLTEPQANFALYAVGVIYMLIAAWDFLRRDFYTLCDRPFFIIIEVIFSYGMMLVFNFAVSMLLSAVKFTDNPNNNAVAALAKEGFGTVAAMAVFLAPIVEELIFRAGIFGLTRRHSRAAAYAASMLFFSLYHVWGYGLIDARYWLYIVQYLPVSWLLARLYERTDSVWSCIFFHMLVNGISVKALTLLG